MRTVSTLVPDFALAAALTAAASALPTPAAAQDVQALLQKNLCITCHAVDRKIVGPAFKDVAAKYANEADAKKTLARHIRAGSSGRWGAVPMPPNVNVNETDAEALATWVLAQKQE